MNKNKNQNDDTKNNKQGSSLRKIITFLLLLTIISSGGYLGYSYYKDWKQDKLLEEALLIYKNTTPTPTPTSTPTPTPTSTPVPTKTLEPTPTPTPIPTPKVIRPEFTALRKQFNNDDIVGYLKIDGTTIDYPVTHFKDNDYYLTHDINKKDSVAGWVYLDYENDVYKEDKNLVIYGHNMNKNYMFHSIRYYAKEDYFKKHPEITFNTLHDDYTWEIFSFYKTNIDFPYIQVNFPNDETYYDLLKTMKSRSVYDTGVEVSEKDRILTLSTCTNVNDDDRFALHARLSKINGVPVVHDNGATATMSPLPTASPNPNNTP